MPDDSYASDFIDYRQKYTERSPVSPYAYFRYVDQYQDDVRNQMKAYVEDLVTIEAIPERPPFFWVEDFQEFVQNNTSTIGQLSFSQQLDEFLAKDEFKLLYGPHIIRDEATGDIFTSRVQLFMDNVFVGEVNEEVDALEDQKHVTARQPVNWGRTNYAFFLYDDLFQIWGR